MYIYIYVYTCIYIYIYVYIHTHVYTYMNHTVYTWRESREMQAQLMSHVDFPLGPFWKDGPVEDESRSLEGDL